jgi:alkaline phosphatase D
MLEGPGHPSPFSHAVASFDPEGTRVVLWTRVTDRGTLTWHVSRSVDGRDVVAEGTVAVPPDTDGCVTVEVDGLEPATTYHYWFDLDGVLSPIGRTRTLPVGPTEWFRLAMVCCADPAKHPLAAYRAAAEDEVDVVLHLGDYIYETDEHGAEPDHTCVTLDDYRRRHAFIRADPDLQALHLRHPMIFVWDDHDVADNAWRHGAKKHDPDEHGPWEDRLAAAATARQQWVPARLREPDDLLAMWRSFAIGDLAELVLLDTRIPGRDEQSEGRDLEHLCDPSRSMLDPDQRAWAYDRIRDRERPWCLLATAVVLSPLELHVPAGALIDDAMPSGYDVIDGEAVCTDEWDGYPVERRKLLNVVAERGGGTVLLSGDVHSSWAFETRNDPTLAPVAVEFVAPAVSSTPMGDQLPGVEHTAELVADDVPNQRWHDLHHHGYVRLDVRPGEVRADWLAVDDDDRSVPPRTLASWAVDPAFPPRLRPATPSIPDAAIGTDDARTRPGLPLDVLPLPAARSARPEPRAAAIGRVALRAAPLVAVGVAVALVLRRRRGGRSLSRRR